MALLSRIKTWVEEVLTPSDLNAEFDNVINTGLKADKIVGSSADVTAMRALTDPGEVGTESLASDVEGEVKRLRNIVKEILGEAQWYVSPTRDLSAGSLAVLTADIVAGEVKTANIGAGAVTATELGTDSVTTDKILAGAVDTSELAASSVSTAKVQDGAITRAKRAAIGEVVSAPGAISTGSTSFITVATRAYTVSSAANALLIFVDGDGSNPARARVSSVTSGNTIGEIRIRRTVPSIADIGIFEFGGDVGVGGAMSFPIGVIGIDTGTVTGASTYLLEVRLKTGSGSDIVQLQDVTLVIVEF